TAERTVPTRGIAPLGMEASVMDGPLSIVTGGGSYLLYGECLTGSRGAGVLLPTALRRVVTVIAAGHELRPSDVVRKREVQALADLAQLLADTVGRGRAAAHPHKATLLEHADRSDVVHDNERVERARTIVAEELRERRSGDSAPPVLAADPV